MKFEELLKMPLPSKMEKEGFFYETPTTQLKISSINECKIILHTNEGLYIPHFHVTGKRFDCPIRLDKAEYFNHGSKQQTLTSDQIDRLVDIMKTIEPGKKYTVWETFARKWNHTPMGYVTKVDIKHMPDYTELKGKNIK